MPTVKEEIQDLLVNLNPHQMANRKETEEFLSALISDDEHDDRSLESENEPSTPDIDEDNVLNTSTLDDENSGGSLAESETRSSTDELDFDEPSSFSSTIPEVDDVVSNVDKNEEGTDKGETSADELGVDELMDHSVNEEEISEGFIEGDDLNTEHTRLDDDLFLPLTSIWPVYLEIANYPPSIRFRMDNSIVCGMWVGQSKPPVDIMLQPIMEEIDQLNTLGFTFSSPDGIKTVRIKLLFGVFDLVAKAKILNMTQFNGYYGCSTCLHPGQHHERRRVYATDKEYPMRTEAGMERDVQASIRQNTIVHGIKGKSPLYGYLSMINGIPPDYMHCVLEGVTKSLLTLWTSSNYHNKPYSIRRDLPIIDAALCTQTPPHEFSRSPRSIVQNMSYWKASEFRSWLLFYSLPLLLNALPPLYFHHYALLVCAMHILLAKEVTEIECSAAEEMLTDFCKLLPELYENGGPVGHTQLSHLKVIMGH
uniref:Transposase domain-containing protein n=1 Tax=Amphimedon queenslandica TaxID=400682 RepID=A0A1X7TS34_AMPQE